jgi:hypothetical protein
VFQLNYKTISTVEILVQSCENCGGVNLAGMYETAGQQDVVTVVVSSSSRSGRGAAPVDQHRQCLPAKNRNRGFIRHERIVQILIRPCTTLAEQSSIEENLF